MKNDWEDFIVRFISQEIPEIPYEILISLLKTVGTVEDDVFIPDRIKLYQMCAIDLFLTSSEYLYDEFVIAYKKLTDLIIYRKFLSKFKLEDILSGIAIQRTHEYRSKIKYLPKYRLSYNLDERLQLLFSIKEKWSEIELSTYLADVTKLTMPQLLLKHAKRIMEGNTVMYTSKLN